MAHIYALLLGAFRDLRGVIRIDHGRIVGRLVNDEVHPVVGSRLVRDDLGMSAGGGCL